MRLEVGLWAHLKNRPNEPRRDGTVTYPTVEIVKVDDNRIQVKRVESGSPPPFWVDADELGQSPWERPTPVAGASGEEEGVDHHGSC